MPAAIPVGGFFGYVCGYFIGRGILLVRLLRGEGSTVDDMYWVVGLSMIGFFLGMLILPVCLWLFLRQNKR